MLGAGRLLFAEADGLDLVFARAEEHQHLLHGVGASLAEADVVLAAAALIAVALDQHLGGRVVAQELGMRLDQRLELVLDVELVEVEVDRALGQDVVRILERGEPRRTAPRRRLDLRHRLRLHRLRFRRRLCRLDWRGGGGFLFFGSAAEQQRRRHHWIPKRTHVFPPCHSMNGPQAGSRTSPAAVLRRCLTLPSADTADSTPRSLITVASRIMRPFGAKLGDSSRSLSVRICTWRFDKSSSATWNLPAALRVMYAIVLPSGLIRGDTL